MLKRICILMLSFIFIVAMAACEAGQSSSTKTPANTRKTEVYDYLASVDETYKTFFLTIEAGGYADAEELIQTHIVGNLVTEEESQRVCKQYVEALLKDYNYGRVDDSVIDIISKTMEKTSMSSYDGYFYLLEEYKFLSRSKQAYQEGLDAYNIQKYAEAVAQLSNVLTSDTYYNDSVNLLVEMAQKTYESSDIEDLRIAGQAALRVIRSFNELLSGGSYLYIYGSDALTMEEIDELRATINSIALRVANSLEKTGATGFALQLYSLLSDEYLEAKDQFVTITRQLNFECVGAHNTFYSLDLDGTVNRESEYGFRIEHRAFDALQMVVSEEYTNGDCAFYALLCPNGTVRLLSTKEADESGSAFQRFREEVDALEGIVKIFAPCLYTADAPSLIALTNKGTIEFCGSLGSDAGEMLWYDNIVDFYGESSVTSRGMQGEFIVLTADGTVYTSSSVSNASAYQLEHVKAIKGFNCVLTDAGKVIGTGRDFYDQGPFVDAIVDGGEDSPVTICGLSEDGEFHGLMGLWCLDVEMTYPDYTFSRLVNGSHAIVGYTIAGEPVLLLDKDFEG